LSGKEVVVYVGGLYAEKVMGMAKTLKNLEPDGVEQLIIATVGIGDPAAPETAAILQKSLKSQIPPALLEKAHIFHLRGDIDYDKLKPRHKCPKKKATNRCASSWTPMAKKPATWIWTPWPPSPPASKQRYKLKYSTFGPPPFPAEGRFVVPGIRYPRYYSI
jgi:hypothetical protein